MGKEQVAKAQTEIGPTTYAEDGTITKHGPNDPETKAAYAGGHPSESGFTGVRMGQPESAPVAAPARSADAPVADAPVKAAKATRPSKAKK